MKHELFGTLKFKSAVASWLGKAPLALFAQHGARAPQKPLTEEQAEKMLADMNQALDNMRGMLKEKFGPSAETAIGELEKKMEADAEAADEPEEIDEERERLHRERDARRAEKLALGLFPVRVADPEELGPTVAQEAAFRHLLENETAVFDAVLAQVWESFQHSYADENWRMIMGLQPAGSANDLRGRFAIERVEVVLEERGGYSHLVFSIDSDWQDEHGLHVVYSPDRNEAAWTALDGLDELLETDEPEDDYVPTPRDELLEAILSGEDERAKEMIAAGIDLNDLDVDEFPPLCIAVEQVEVEDVRRLLAFGADPNLPQPDTNITPLKQAKKTYRELGFGPSKKNDPLRDAMMILAKETVGGQLDEIKTRLEVIIEMLAAAGGK